MSFSMQGNRVNAEGNFIGQGGRGSGCGAGGAGTGGAGAAGVSYIHVDGVAYTLKEYAELERAKALNDKLDRIEAKLDLLLDQPRR